MKSTDVIGIYDASYFLGQVDGFEEFGTFSGRFEDLFLRYQRNVALLDLQRSHEFIEIGCGRGEVCIFHAMRGGVARGIDFSQDAIAMARSKANSLGAKVLFENIPFAALDAAPNSCDRMLASEFIEHISKSEGEAFFALAFKLLRPGGRLLVYTLPNTLQRKYGYPLLRLYAAMQGITIPKVQSDTLSEHYRLYHLNEQNFFSLRRYAAKAGFAKFSVQYDVSMPLGGAWIKRTLRALVAKTPLRHIFYGDLYLVAEK